MGFHFLGRGSGKGLREFLTIKAVHFEQPF